MSILKDFQTVANERPAELRKAKDEGKKVIEYIGQYVPEEMIYAAGAEPYFMIKGGEPEPPDAVLEDMLRFMNPYARSLAGYNLMGLDPVTPFADLIVAQQLDCHVGRISELMEFHGLPVYKVGVPVEWKKDFARKYFKRSLEKLKKRLEDETGNEITNEVLKAEVEKSNKIRKVIRELDELRKEDNPKISGHDFIKLNHFTYKARPEVALDYLEKFYEEAKTSEGNTVNGPRILFAGHIVAQGDYTVPRLIEEAGGKIVADMFDDGLRWYRNDIATEGDMIENIHQAKYLDKIAVNMFQPAWNDRYESLMEIVKEYKVDAVIWYQLSFDEIYDMEHTVLAKRLSEAGIPLLKLESSYEYSREAMGPLQTRIESFIEAVKEGK
ncbi:2-hydroxyacyl-CoA dehydratase subunit D [Anaeromicrobium sediminis]|uniref:2-hydroxyglutaryl-CoA dehydratase n=1 Tax=Anaeromicrobium sediminis TaxID=1478221 RepID=A0A267MNW0_9FIRM|nr:2-hydroxyacyl-CoA dehydratase family protein [Anaeromicrobium sediminis]PAB60565.1 hypothetical protein CCE28_03200 [Anaeromicrobium sediminis]